MSAGSQRVRLSYEDLYQLKWLLGAVLALISLWTLYYLDVRSGPLLLLVTAAVVLVAAFPRLPGRVPEVVWKAVPPALVLAIVADFMMARSNIIPPLLRMVLLLLLVRSVQYRSRREDLQLIMICLFVIVISGVLTLSIAFAVQIVLFAPAAMALLFIINLSECHDREGNPHEGVWDHFAWGRFAGRVWAVIDLRMLGFAALLFLGVVGASSLIFVIMPRVGFDQAIPFLKLESQSRSGFSEEIRYGDVVSIKEDNGVAFSVERPVGVEAPILPYWRMVIFDEYYYYSSADGGLDGSFRTSASSKSSKESYNDSYLSDRREYAGETAEPNEWVVYLEGGVSRYLPVLGTFGALRFQGKQTVEFNRAVRTVNTDKKSSTVFSFKIEDMNIQGAIPRTLDDKPFLAKPRPARVEDFEVVDPVSVDLADRAATVEVKYPMTTLVVPAGAENEAELARIVAEITGGEELSAEAFSHRAVDYLNRRHGYSLATEIPPGEADLLVRWMRSSAPGHCELFAGSFVLLARAAGFPCRVVAGFKGWAWNDFEGYYMVRNRDAHAWCEIYDKSFHWLRVDPTPGAGVAVGSPDGPGAAVAASLPVDGSWRAFLESLRILWYRRIVNFDEDTQDVLAEGVRSWFKIKGEEFKDELRERWTAFKDWLSKPWSWGKGAHVLQWVGVGCAVFLLFRFCSSQLVRAGARIRVFGLALGRDPVRHKAGRLVVKFRHRQPDFSTPGPVTRGEWEEVYGELLALRFGAADGRPEPKPVFRRARRLLRGKPARADTEEDLAA